MYRNGLNNSNYITMTYQHEFNINEVLYFTLEATIENSTVSQPKLLNQDEFTRPQLFEIAKFMAFYQLVIKNKFLEIYRQN
jgi:hypothetical protein